MTRDLARLRRIFPQSSLRVRLILMLFTTFLIGLAASVSFFYWEAVGTQAGLRERSLQEQARELLDTIPRQRGGKSELAPRPLNPVYIKRGGAYGFTLYDSTGTVRSVSPSRASKGPLPLTEIPTRNEMFGPVFFAGPTRTAAMTTRPPGDSFFLVVSRDDPDPNTLAASLIEQDATPLIVLSPFVFLALTLIVLIINRMLRPLQRASSEASKIGPSSSTDRVELHGLPSELIPLVTAFNGALDRLSKAYQFEKRLTANAAHELRTPLAVLRMRLDTAHLNDGAPLDWGAVRRDFDQIDRLTAQLLDLARKEQGGLLDCKPEVNLARLAREGAVLMLPLVENVGRSLHVDAPAPVVITSGMEDDLRDTLRNLIENALFHGEGTITITVEGVGEDDLRQALITVADEGCGLLEPLRADLFERFRKGDASTPGAGLGLAIVRQVAENHEGTVSFLPGPECRVQIILPLSRSAANS